MEFARASGNCTMTNNRKIRDVRRALDNAVDYDSWHQAAMELDRLEGYDEWRANPESPDYDYELIADRLTLLRRLRGAGEPETLMYELRQGLHWNLGNIGNPVMYAQAYVGTKRLVDDYLQEVVAGLDWLCDTEFAGLSRLKKARFFDDVAQSYGRSALMLSGGATMGLFHVGVVKTLYLQDLLPDVLSGSSAGSLVGAAIACRSPAEADQLLDPSNMFVDLWSVLGPREAWHRGALMDQEKLRRGIAENMPDMTFEDSYKASGMSFNITVSPVEVNQPPRLLNHLTFPHLYIREAVLASCAVPMLFPPVQLSTRNVYGQREPYMPSLRWADGSLKSDLPRLRLRRLHNVNHFIVSQTNPHVLPFLSAKEPGERGYVHAVRHLAYSTVKSQAKNILHVTRSNLPRGMPNLRRHLDSAHGILEQDYRGNITIVPPFDARNYLRVIRNPRREDIIRMILQGEQSTWPRVSMIRHQTLISATLERCKTRLVAQRRQRQRSHAEPKKAS